MRLLNPHRWGRTAAPAAVGRAGPSELGRRCLETPYVVGLARSLVCAGTTADPRSPSKAPVGLPLSGRARMVEVCKQALRARPRALLRKWGERICERRAPILEGPLMLVAGPCVLKRETELGVGSPQCRGEIGASRAPPTPLKNGSCPKIGEH